MMRIRRPADTVMRTILAAVALVAVVVNTPAQQIPDAPGAGSTKNEVIDELVKAR